MSLFGEFSVFTFEVCVANRYKLNKKYRKLKSKANNFPDNITAKHYASQAKVTQARVENPEDVM